MNSSTEPKLLKDYAETPKRKAIVLRLDFCPTQMLHSKIGGVLLGARTF